MTQIENSGTVPRAEDAMLPLPRRDVWLSLWRGFKQCCPACGKGRIYGKYLKVNAACNVCGQELHHHRADDAPPYFTMLVVGHLVIGMLLSVEMHYHPEIWVHAVLWAPITIVLSLLMLPRIKGALIGLQWAMRMHGFGSAPDPAAPETWPPASRPAARSTHA